MNITRQIILVAVYLLCLPAISFARSYKVSVQTPHPALEIIQVDTDEYGTLISFVYQDDTPVNPPDAFFEGLIWRINFQDEAVLKGSDGKDYHLISAINMPISSEAEERRLCLDTKNKRHQFLLEFERLSDEVTSFDLIESETLLNAFNIYGITLLKEEEISPINIASFIKDYPVKEYGSYYVNDGIVQYYKSNGLTVQARIAYRKDYGKFYAVAVDIQNLSGKSILFGRDNVSAYAAAISTEKSKKKRYKTMEYSQNGGPVDAIIPENLYVYSADEYDKKIARSQSISEIFMGIAAGLSTASAGYSTSTTTVSGTSDQYTSSKAYAWGTNGYGFAVGHSNSHGAFYGTSRTDTYNSSEAYWEKRQVYQDLANYSAQNYQIRQSLTDGYLKKNTIKNEQDYTGFCNIEHIKADIIIVRLTVAGEIFDFPL